MTTTDNWKSLQDAVTNEDRLACLRVLTSEAAERCDQLLYITEDIEPFKDRLIPAKDRVESLANVVLDLHQRSNDDLESADAYDNVIGSLQVAAESLSAELGYDHDADVIADYDSWFNTYEPAIEPVEVSTKSSKHVKAHTIDDEYTKRDTRKDKSTKRQHKGADRRRNVREFADSMDL